MEDKEIFNKAHRFVYQYMRDNNISIEDYNFRDFVDYMLVTYSIGYEEVVFGKVFSDYFCGVLATFDEENWSITINKKMIKSRKNFTLCHELAHFVFDADLGKKRELYVTKLSEYSSNPNMEKEAEMIGGVFMLPDECIRHSLLQNKTFHQMCNEYGISKKALCVRIAQYMYNVINYPYHYGWESAKKFRYENKINAVTFLYEENFYPHLVNPSDLYESIAYKQNTHPIAKHG